MTVGWDAGATLADRFRAHAADSQTLYGFAMRAMADDWEAGGPTREVCAGHEDAPSGSVIQLRLLAGLFRIVLTDRAPQLRPFYPCLGGTEPPGTAWPVMRAVIADHVEELRAGLAVAPQTNEVGRSAALLAGLFDVVASSGIRQLRLLEIGASAGLNLLVDRFAFDGPGWSFGPADAVVRLPGAIEGPVRPLPFTIVERRGCDLEPVDPTTPEGRLTLTSYVWPFHLARHQRLAAALTEAQRDPAPVDRASAAAWLPEHLTADADHLTVVWHSVTQLYWPPGEVAAVDAVLAAYGHRSPLARIGMEYAPGSSPTARPVITTTLWMPGPADPRVVQLGTANDHGPPVRLD